jgi:hypothetical protein
MRQAHTDASTAVVHKGVAQHIEVLSIPTGAPWNFGFCNIADKRKFINNTV